MRIRFACLFVFAGPALAGLWKTEVFAFMASTGMASDVIFISLILKSEECRAYPARLSNLSEYRPSRWPGQYLPGESAIAENYAKTRSVRMHSETPQ
ncbi:MAG TPA: hypothetical protein VFD27_05050, partial [Chthoniobacteraceae bacterium]|nr:hypothetical protein [Chthoniobacteraceae bacterium]